MEVVLTPIKLDSKDKRFNHQIHTRPNLVLSKLRANNCIQSLTEIIVIKYLYLLIYNILFI